MDISRNWLAQYVDAGSDVEALCERLTMAGIEVESVQSACPVPLSVVAAKILQREKHPNADHLSVCRVFDGEKELQIVCGAPNCDAGKIVPLAQIGTKFGDFEIKKAKMRGVESFGMLCSEEELGLSDENDGIMELPSGVVPGTPVRDAVGADVRLELEITPNRPDCLSHYGVARDVAALLGGRAQMPEITLPASSGTAKKDLVTVEAPELCSRYIGQVIRGVKIKESPAWLRERLESVGLRAINNVVDVTNFVMLELGQPLHAFDYNRLAGGRIVVRRAKPGEKITILDGRSFELADRHLVICDAEKPMAIAGIMGGEYSGVSEDTCDIMLESAVFDKSNIRFSSSELGISTDASYRFERGIDFDMALQAHRRAAQLILETAGGTLEGEAMDVYAEVPPEAEILCRFDRVRRAIGIDDLESSVMTGIFEALGLKLSEVTAESCKVTVPRFRSDLTREADLVEEVARINGLDKIPVRRVEAAVCHSLEQDAWYKGQNLREMLIALGLYECVHYSMSSLKDALRDSRFKAEDLVALTNPVSADLAYMRPSLFGEMMNTVGRNVARRNLTMKLFEFGKGFCANAGMFKEERWLTGMVLTGQRHPERFSKELEESFDFYDLKGMLEALFEKCRIAKVEFAAASDGRFEDGRCVEIKLNGRTAGFAGEVAAEHAAFRTPYKVYYAELEASMLLEMTRGASCFKALSLFPSTARDVAMVADESLTNQEVINVIRGSKAPNFESVRLFDVFRDEAMKKNGRKSLAYQVVFRNPERTLTDAEVNAAFEKIRERLVKVLKVELR